jgi:hypothetical protein
VSKRKRPSRLRRHSGSVVWGALLVPIMGLSLGARTHRALPVLRRVDEVPAIGYLIPPRRERGDLIRALRDHLAPIRATRRGRVDSFRRVGARRAEQLIKMATGQHRARLRREAAAATARCTIVVLSRRPISVSPLAKFGQSVVPFSEPTADSRSTDHGPRHPREGGYGVGGSQLRWRG